LRAINADPFDKIDTFGVKRIKENVRITVIDSIKSNRPDDPVDRHLQNPLGDFDTISSGSPHPVDNQVSDLLAIDSISPAAVPVMRFEDTVKDIVRR
jgi:hypothetical protein